MALKPGYHLQYSPKESQITKRLVGKDDHSLQAFQLDADREVCDGVVHLVELANWSCRGLTCKDDQKYGFYTAPSSQTVQFNGNIFVTPVAKNTLRYICLTTLSTNK